MFSNDLDQSLVFTVAFLAAVSGLMFALAWLEEPHAAVRLLAHLSAKVRGPRRPNDSEPHGQGRESRGGPR